MKWNCGKGGNEWNGKKVIDGMERKVTNGIEKKVTGNVKK
jgi:hypothetical protein